MNKEIIKISQVVRNICEQFAFSKNAKDFDFYKRKDLSCMCAIASMALAKVLRKFKIKANVVDGSFIYDQSNHTFGHCWVECGNHIIDITATQFKIYQDIFITHKRNNLNYIKGIIKNKIIYFSDWPNTQQPNDNIVRRLVNNSLMVLRKG